MSILFYGINFKALVLLNYAAWRFNEYRESVNYFFKS